jgi:hypothetical protein
LKESDSLPNGVDEVASHAIQIMVPNSPYNRLVVSTVHYSASNQIHTLVGAAPLFWWGLPLEHASDVLFGRVQLLSMYNPAPLIEALVSAGFEVVEDAGHPYTMRLQKDGDRIVRFENVWYFMTLTGQFMFKIDRVAQIVLEFIRRSESAVGETGGKVDLVFNHRPFAPPADLADIHDLTGG